MRYIEKRFECFYKLIEQILESDVNIDNKYDQIIENFKEIRRYDYLAKDEATKDF
jgi:hypothetical protein